MPSIHVIYASTSGHTEFVCETLKTFLETKGKMTVTLQRAEKATVEDLMKGDVLVLASSTWNTGGPEGQLNPHMQKFLWDRAKTAELRGRPVAVIGLGDERYRYTARAGDYLRDFVNTHGGKEFGALKIVNEPYHQTDVIEQFAIRFMEKVKLEFPKIA